MDVDTEVERLKSSYYALLELISRLSESSSSNKRQELTDTVQLRLKDYESGVKSLDFLIADDLDPELKKQHLVSLDRLKEDLKIAKNRFRSAQIQAKKNSELNWKQQREKLFGGVSAQDGKPNSNNKELSTEERIVNKSEDVTSTLRRVHQMAQTEVVKSSLNIEELEYSTKSLGELEKRYNAFDVLLNGSQRLVKHLEEADKWDRYYMLFSLGFLALVLAWIIWRRVLKVPTKLLMWTLGRMLGIARIITAPGGSKALKDGVETILETVESTPTITDEIGNAATSLIETLYETPTEIISESIKSEL